MGTPCGAGYVDLQVVRLPRALAAYAGPDFRSWPPTSARIAGSQAGPRDWIVYADGMRQGSVAGTGEFYYGPSAEAPGATSHDAGRLVSVVWGPASVPAGAYADPTTMLHEMGHNLGAVQGGAPHTTGTYGGSPAGHCTDEWDVMCYADGGSQNVMTYPCDELSGAVVEAFDCNGDDYFNPAPAAGSWLAAHWNLYASAMLGDCAAELTAACDAVDPPAPAPLNTTPASPSGWVRAPYSVTLSGAGATRFEWRVDGGAAQATAHGHPAGRRRARSSRRASARTPPGRRGGPRRSGSTPPRPTCRWAASASSCSTSPARRAGRTRSRAWSTWRSPTAAARCRS